MINHFPFLPAGSVPAASSPKGQLVPPPDAAADLPTLESVGFEIAVILAVLLSIAGVVPLVLGLYGVE